MFGTLNTDFRGAVENGGKPVFSTPISKSGSSFKLSGDMFGAIASLINTGVSAGLANSQSRRAYRQQLGLLEAQTNTQKSLMDYQDAINVRNWNMQNEYNTPAAQRERLENAGLNPNLMFGAGGSVGIASGSSPSVSAQPSSVPHSQGVDAYYQQMRLGQEFAMNAAQIGLIKAQTDKTEKEAGNVDLNSQSQRMLNASQVGLNASLVKQTDELTVGYRYANNYTRDTYSTRVAQATANLNLTQNQADLFFAQTDLAIYTYEQLLPLQRDQLSYMLNEVMPAQVEEIKSRTGLNHANAAAAWANSFLSYAEAALARSRKKGQDIQNEFNEKIFKDPRYQEGVVQGAVQLARNYEESANYNAAHANNEEEGLPYLITFTESYSEGSSQSSSASYNHGSGSATGSSSTSRTPYQTQAGVGGAGAAIIANSIYNSQNSSSGYSASQSSSHSNSRSTQVLYNPVNGKSYRVRPSERPSSKKDRKGEKPDFKLH